MCVFRMLLAAHFLWPAYLDVEHTHIHKRGINWLCRKCELLTRTFKVQHTLVIYHPWKNLYFLLYKAFFKVFFSIILYTIYGSKTNLKHPAATAHIAPDVIQLYVNFGFVIIFLLRVVFFSILAKNI